MSIQRVANQLQSAVKQQDGTYASSLLLPEGELLNAVCAENFNVRYENPKYNTRDIS